MKRIAPPRDKYFLRSLHQEIDLYDRKLAYLNNYEVFATAADRKVAEDKMLDKRAALERTAKELVAAGVEFNEADLPRSFRAAHAESAKHEGVRSVQDQPEAKIA